MKLVSRTLFALVPFPLQVFGVTLQKTFTHFQPTVDNVPVFWGESFRIKFPWVRPGIGIMMNIPGGYHYSTSLRNELLRNVSYLTLFSDFVCLFDWRPARKKRRWHPINMDFASRPGLALVIIHTSRSRSSRLISTQEQSKHCFLQSSMLIPLMCSFHLL